jgi:hypothetical protein
VNGIASVRTSWVPPISGKDSGSLVFKAEFPTPTARDHHGAGNPDKVRERGHTPMLNDEVGGKLNPTWVEWLMGWPLGWTALRPLEMDRFREWRNSFSSDSLGRRTHELSEV